jgi:hypothetical protein
LLHEVAEFFYRPLLTHDNNPEWLRRLQEVFQSGWHRFGMLNRQQWAEYLWGMVYVDHGPRPEEPRNSKGLLNALDRGQAVLDLMDRTDVFVLHDTEPPVCWEYDWEKIFPLFKYRKDDATHGVHTSILSNRTDVTKWI